MTALRRHFLLPLFVLVMCGLTAAHAAPASTPALPPFPPIAVTVNWNNSIAQATSLSYGLNAFAGFDPAVTNNYEYGSGLRFMSPGILRLHNAGMLGDSQKNPNGWVDVAHQRWDAAKIKAALGGFPPGLPLLINIPGWPDWMDKDNDGFLDAGQAGNYAQFCADLVRIVNKDLGRHVGYWEVTNEQDGRYFADFHTAGGWGPLKDPAKPDRVEELAGIYVQCADAMKAVDPSIQVGGPAQARPDLIMFARRFAHVAASRLDFYSFHAYASGSAADSDEAVFNAAVSFGDAAKAFGDALRAESPSRPIPVFLDEYNISWTWETRDPRMIDVKGAVFDALAITAAVTHGAAATLAWNEKDGIYGKMDDHYALRPGATLFHWLNTDMIGAVVPAASADPQAVVAYAVRTPKGRRSLLLINRSARTRSVTLTPWGRATLNRSLLAAAGSADTRLTPVQLASPLPLPADSLILLTSE